MSLLDYSLTIAMAVMVFVVTIIFVFVVVDMFNAQDFCKGNLIERKDYSFCDGKPFVCNTWSHECNYINLTISIEGEIR